MRLLTDGGQFIKVLEPATKSELVDFNIVPDVPSGEFFGSERLKELEDFCQKFPQFHITSEVHIGCIYNRYVEDSRAYILCGGDRDPSIIYINVGFFIGDKDPDLLEFMAREFPAVDYYLRVLSKI